MSEVLEKIIFKDLDIKELSPTSKIFLVGRYAEIFFRFDQKLSDNDYFTLGQGANSFKGQDSQKYTIFENHFNNIKDMRNKCVHTQNLYIATETEFENVKEDLFYLYSFLFFKYFLNKSFGKNYNLMTLFSILPPKIRSITLFELLKYDPNNQLLIDKAILASIKAENLPLAEQILENGSEYLKNHYDFFLKKTSYELFKEKFEFEKNHFLNNKKLYSTLPEAGTVYRQERKKFASLNDKDVNDLLELMDFIYKGF